MLCFFYQVTQIIGFHLRISDHVDLARELWLSVSILLRRSNRFVLNFLLPFPAQLATSHPQHRPSHHTMLKLRKSRATGLFILSLFIRESTSSLDWPFSSITEDPTEYHADFIIPHEAGISSASYATKTLSTAPLLIYLSSFLTTAEAGHLLELWYPILPFPPLAPLLKACTQ